MAIILSLVPIIKNPCRRKSRKIVKNLTGLINVKIYLPTSIHQAAVKMAIQKKCDVSTLIVKARSLCISRGVLIKPCHCQLATRANGIQVNDVDLPRSQVTSQEVSEYLSAAMEIWEKEK